MKLSAGTLLQGGKYRIEEHLGSGGFGCTYKAYYNTMGCYVAIKEFFVKDFCNREEDGTVKVATQGKTELVEKLRNKFFNEARTLFSSKMYHSNIVRVSDVFEENGTVYYVMDYIEGSTLATLIEQKGYLAEDEALRYIRQVADALKHLHANNCLHLDVKPANIMIDGSGKAVLIDFGVSKQYDEANGENTSTLLGHTPGYAPIEQSGRGLIKFNAACDIYALGATLYKALTGTTPVEATLRAGDKSLCELAYPEHVSVAIRTAIDKAMQISRGDRPQSIEEFLCLVESGKIKDESGKPDAGETVLNGNVKGASKREGENLFTHTASESSFDEVKGENGKLVADESQSIDVVEVPDSADTVISNEGEKSHSADAVIFRGKPSTARLSVSEESQPANNEILRSAQNDNSANGRQNDKDGNEKAASKREGEILFTYTASESSFDEVKVERINEKEHSAGVVISNVGEKSQSDEAVISNGGEKSQKNKPGKSLWLILLLLLIAVAGAWFLLGGTGNGDASKRDTKKDSLTSAVGEVQEKPDQVASLTTGKHNGHDWVDLGLPSGLKWATRNVGASSPSDYGDYFAWGETSTKSSYTDANSTTYFKEIGDIAGNPTYDVARAEWRGSWRLPTEKDFQELIDNCEWEWTTQDGHKGYKVTSRKNGNSIFLPAAGWYYGSSSDLQGSYGNYWSATPYESDTYNVYAYVLDFNEDYRGTGRYVRDLGRSVRPVFQNN